MSLRGTLSFMLQQEGVIAGSVWRCYRQPTDEKSFALIDVQEVDGEKINFDVHPKEKAFWGNTTPEILELTKLDAAGIITLILENRLVPVK